MKNTLEKIKKYLYDSEFRIRINTKMGIYNSMDDKNHIEKLFRASMDYNLDLHNPKTFNEKLQWLKLYNRRPEYTKMVDKYKVREYISEKIGEEYLIPLLGVWDDPDEIDFDLLPNKFVFKCNHNSGLGMTICKDKSKLDLKRIKSNLKKGLKQDYYLTGREWPYKNVPRKIICEKYMKDNNNDSLINYKFYCFNGQAKFIQVSYGLESKETSRLGYYDLNFNRMELYREDYKLPEKDPKRPNKLDEMISISNILSEDIPYVRVDLYEINEKVYFSELTFFPGSGFIKLTPKEWDYRLGRLIDIQENKVTEEG